MFSLAVVTCAVLCSGFILALPGAGGTVEVSVVKFIDWEAVEMCERQVMWIDELLVAGSNSEKTARRLRNQRHVLESRCSKLQQ